jgi:hypothetical protein
LPRSRSEFREEFADGCRVQRLRRRPGDPAQEVGGEEVLGGHLELFGEGFLLTNSEMDWFETNYLGSERTHAGDPRASPGH